MLRVVLERVGPSLPFGGKGLCGLAWPPCWGIASDVAHAFTSTRMMHGKDEG